MWVFGYGSLMWDGWQDKNGRRCLRTSSAELRGYRRIFNKKSVRNWGTRALPCPTLNLEGVSTASCRGMAFEFHHDDWFIGQMLLWLRQREACEPRELPIRIDDASEVNALVYIYAGPSLIKDQLAPEQLAAMCVKASGADGLCINYIKGIAEKLAALGIDDRAVADLWHAVKAAA
jgi:cation transport protein ChaC